MRKTVQSSVKGRFSALASSSLFSGFSAISDQFPKILAREWASIDVFALLVGVANIATLLASLASAYCLWETRRPIIVEGATFANNQPTVPTVNEAKTGKKAKKNNAVRFADTVKENETVSSLDDPSLRSTSRPVDTVIDPRLIAGTEQTSFLLKVFHTTACAVAVGNGFFGLFPYITQVMDAKDFMSVHPAILAIIALGFLSGLMVLLCFNAFDPQNPHSVEKRRKVVLFSYLASVFFSLLNSLVLFVYFDRKIVAVLSFGLTVPQLLSSAFFSSPSRYLQRLWSFTSAHTTFCVLFMLNAPFAPSCAALCSLAARCDFESLIKTHGKMKTVE
eukprot:TRINITY_DN8661_c0_g1_i1.p1 TRINITY_DN8661_c0_g1~~TRINITY_DN8661_c0_g1_i1.p1  ORF type:complete len:364 (-),score=58.91 TRINITY_DN8661_c0_g1_i1:85-1086(-)